MLRLLVGPAGTSGRAHFERPAGEPNHRRIAAVRPARGRRLPAIARSVAAGRRCSDRVRAPDPRHAAVRGAILPIVTRFRDGGIARAIRVALPHARAHAHGRRAHLGYARARLAVLPRPAIGRCRAGHARASAAHLAARAILGRRALRRFGRAVVGDADLPSRAVGGAVAVYAEARAGAAHLVAGLARAVRRARGFCNALGIDAKAAVAAIRCRLAVDAAVKRRVANAVGAVAGLCTGDRRAAAARLGAVYASAYSVAAVGRARVAIVADLHAAPADRVRARCGAVAPVLGVDGQREGRRRGRRLSAASEPAEPSKHHAQMSNPVEH